MADLSGYLTDGYVKGTAENRRVWQRWAKTALTTVAVPFAKRKASQLLAQDKDGLRLHIGCGTTYIPEWINIDLVTPNARRDMYWDLKRGIPFPDGSAQAIFSEHLFEHIPLPAGLALLRECKRTLRPGGIIRVGVPDLERYVRSYLGQDSIIETVRPGRATRGIAIAELFYFNGHCAAYDAETLALVLTTAGFTNAKKSEFGESALRPCPDSQHRRAETLYVEATA